MGQSTTLFILIAVSSLTVRGQDSISIHVDTPRFIEKSYQRGEGLNGKFVGLRTYSILTESFQPKAGYNKIVRDNGSLYFEGRYVLVDTIFKRVGVFKFYEISGQLDYMQDFNTNQRIYYFDDGTKKSQGLVDELGKRTGIWTCYYSSGQIKSRGKIEDKLKKGVWEHFDQGGELKRKIKYRRFTGASENQDCCEW
jgi:antitoxin component YwqK of YwqJK toxin-antitoxin module